MRKEKEIMIKIWGLAKERQRREAERRNVRNMREEKGDRHIERGLE